MIIFFGSSGFFVGGIVTLIQICVRSATCLSDSDIPRAKAPRTPSSEIYFLSLRPLRLFSGHALRPFGYAQDMLCGK
jgi:hypothetical protein